jgi:hypothetical protein
MYVCGLQMPPLLVDLLDAGAWPTARDPLGHPNLVGEVVTALAPDEHEIYLYRPPFKTVAQRIADGQPTWTMPWSAPTEIDFEAVVVIADFGWGSDSPIILDYAQNRDKPIVRRLLWPRDCPPDTPNEEVFARLHWVTLTATFDEFADRLGLTR